jgi:hypothetical protein
VKLIEDREYIGSPGEGNNVDSRVIIVEPKSENYSPFR